jgi:hypothetical protein
MNSGDVTVITVHGVKMQLGDRIVIPSGVGNLLLVAFKKQQIPHG